MPYAYGLIVHVIALAVCALAYYRAAQIEDASGILWATASMLVYLLTWLVLGWGIMGNVLGQVGLLVVIGIVRAVHHSTKP